MDKQAALHADGVALPSQSDSSLLLSEQAGANPCLPAGPAAAPSPGQASPEASLRAAALAAMHAQAATAAAATSQPQAQPQAQPQHQEGSAAAAAAAFLAALEPATAAAPPQAAPTAAREPVVFRTSPARSSVQGSPGPPSRPPSAGGPSSSALGSTGAPTGGAFGNTAGVARPFGSIAAAFGSTEAAFGSGAPSSGAFGSVQVCPRLACCATAVCCCCQIAPRPGGLPCVDKAGHTSAVHAFVVTGMHLLYASWGGLPGEQGMRSVQQLLHQCKAL